MKKQPLNEIAISVTSTTPPKPTREYKYFHIFFAEEFVKICGFEAGDRFSTKRDGNKIIMQLDKNGKTKLTNFQGNPRKLNLNVETAGFTMDEVFTSGTVRIPYEISDDKMILDLPNEFFVSNKIKGFRNLMADKKKEKGFNLFSAAA